MANESNKSKYKAYLDILAGPDSSGFASAVENIFADDATINMVHPFNELVGTKDYLKRFLGPLLQSFERLHRQDYILMGGQFDSAEWVSSTGYYGGHFAHDWLGIKASNRLAYLRVGEFHKMRNGKIVESYIYLDIPELMMAVNQWPLSHGPAATPGYTGFLPGPATGDGVVLRTSDVAESEKSLTMVTDMLLKLNTPDQGWRPYWHENMIWYGPAAFGSFIGIENFASFQVPFEQCFSSWTGGAVEGSETRHFIRCADGHYVCSGGWPSLNAFQTRTFLDQPATDKMLYMRVCDWWRRQDEKLVENWVFVDIPHVLLQMGFDLFASLNVPGPHE